VQQQQQQQQQQLSTIEIFHRLDSVHAQIILHFFSFIRFQHEKLHHMVRYIKKIAKAIVLVFGWRECSCPHHAAICYATGAFHSISQCLQKKGTFKDRCKIAGRHLDVLALQALCINAIANANDFHPFV